MALVLLIFTGIWIVGARMKVSRQERWLVIALLYTIVIALQIILPEGARLRQITGGSAGSWLVLGGMFALVAGYRMGLSRLRGKVAPSASPHSAGGDAFSEAELERYARHIVLREIGGVGQKQLKAAKVLVVGAGPQSLEALLHGVQFVAQPDRAGALGRHYDPLLLQLPTGALLTQGQVLDGQLKHHALDMLRHALLARHKSRNVRSSRGLCSQAKTADRHILL